MERMTLGDTLPNDGQWWDCEDPEQRCIQANAACEAIALLQTGRQAAMATFLRAYRSRINAGYMPASVALQSLAKGGVLSLNVIRAVTNTMVSRIGKNRPRCMFLTTGGKSEDRAKAKAYQFYVDGSFYKSKTYETTRKALLCALMFGTGVVRTGEGHGCVKDTNVLPSNIIIDPRDGVDGDPRQLHEISWVDKGVLAGQYKDKRTEILAIEETDAGGVDALEEFHLNFDQGWGGYSKKVKVVTSYHLPSYPGAKDGKMCVSAGQVALSHQDWDDECFPYSFLRWADDPVDFWGSGLAEELMGIQNEINYLVRKIQMCAHFMSAPYVLADKASGVDKTTFNGKVGNIVWYVGREPRVANWDVVPRDLFMQLDSLYARAFELSGVAAASAQGTPNSNLRSGRGALVEDDKQTVRFSDFETKWEEFHCEIGRRHVYFGMENADYSVVAKDNDILRAVKGQELDLDKESWRIQRWPGSLMPLLPAGRVQMMEQLIQIFPQLPPDVIAAMLGDSDMSHHFRKLTAPYELVEKIIDAALTKGTVTSPDPAMPLDLLQQRGQLSYCLALLEGLDIDDPKAEALRRTLTNARAVLEDAKRKAAEEQMQQQAMAQMGGPMPDPAQAPPDPRMAAAGAQGMMPGPGAEGLPTDPAMM